MVSSVDYVVFVVLSWGLKAKRVGEQADFSHSFDTLQTWRRRSRVYCNHSIRVCYPHVCVGPFDHWLRGGYDGNSRGD
ncbi:hypothetical protein D5086_025334 [Populus alba]|uniref:Uncharacterized protein n=1 Tax=Populus alba TaxID=43335 RepID=A0ACC4AYY0_POPAL